MHSLRYITAGFVLLTRRDRYHNVTFLKVWPNYFFFYLQRLPHTRKATKLATWLDAWLTAHAVPTLLSLGLAYEEISMQTAVILADSCSWTGTTGSGSGCWMSWWFLTLNAKPCWLQHKILLRKVRRTLRTVFHSRHDAMSQGKLFSRFKIVIFSLDKHKFQV